MNSPVRMGVSAHTTTLTGFFQSEVLRLYFPTLGHWVAQSVLLPSSSSQFICIQMRDCLLCQLPPHLLHLLPTCCEYSPPWLPISAPPSGLNECFFFNSLVVVLPYSSIFCQFWLFLFLNLLLSFFWFCKEAWCVYLFLHLGCKSQLTLLLVVTKYLYAARKLWRIFIIISKSNKLLRGFSCWALYYLN